MMSRRYIAYGLLLAAILAVSVFVVTRLNDPPRTALPPELDGTAPEQVVREIPLAGDLTDPGAEVSGLAWYGDVLIILPQYPDWNTAPKRGRLFAIPKETILAFLDGQVLGPITPQPIPFEAGTLATSIEGFQGFEAIGFQGETVYLTVEASRGRETVGYLVRGQMGPDLSGVRVDDESVTELAPAAAVENAGYEALVVTPDGVLTMYEANGHLVNPQPVAQHLGLDTGQLTALPFPTIEYRITDATEVDASGRFWALNYIFPGSQSKYRAEGDALVAGYGTGPTHAKFHTVERLVAFNYTSAGVTLAETAPIQFQLVDDDHSRNWEGVAWLGGHGFLLATDKFPGTILGFVAEPK